MSNWMSMGLPALERKWKNESDGLYENYKPKSPPVNGMQTIPERKYIGQNESDGLYENHKPKSAIPMANGMQIFQERKFKHESEGMYEDPKQLMHIPEQRKYKTTT
eukprot:UN09932